MLSGLYMGSFDPLTHGHVHIIREATEIFGRLVIVLGINRDKSALFSWEERHKMLSKFIESDPKLFLSVTVKKFEGLAIEAAKAFQANVLVRGLRTGEDCDYELPMAHANKKLASNIHTIFIPSSSELQYISSSLVRQIFVMGGDISPFVPQQIVPYLKSKTT